MVDGVREWCRVRLVRGFAFFMSPSPLGRTQYIAAQYDLGRMPVHSLPIENLPSSDIAFGWASRGVVQSECGCTRSPRD